GFSLLELLVVLAVMGVMMGVLGFSILGNSSSNLADTQRMLISYLQKTRALAVASGLETRIIVFAEGANVEKYLRYAQIVTLDENKSDQWLIRDNGISLPQDIWFISDSVESANSDWPRDGECVWSASEQDEDFRLSFVKSNSGDKKVFQETVEGDRFLYLKCTPNGNFSSSSYPKMPKLVFAAGRLIPSPTGDLFPSFTNERQIAGVQIQPYGGILSLDSQDFTYD
ncbi:MAG: prepilin-type N-terminal cleavage/methylation domain-containing protein, partial [Opitutae bacterium]